MVILRERGCWKLIWNFSMVFAKFVLIWCVFNATLFLRFYEYFSFDSKSNRLILMHTQTTHLPTIQLKDSHPSVIYVCVCVWLTIHSTPLQWKKSESIDSFPIRGGSTKIEIEVRAVGFSFKIESDFVLTFEIDAEVAELILPFSFHQW